jgi:uncharacterized protein YggE
MKRILIAAFATAVSMTAFAQTNPPREPAPVDTISVTGTARVPTPPDHVSFNVSVQTISPTVEEAVNENNAKVAAVIAALKAAGAKPEEIQTSNFSVFPQQDYSQQQQGKLPRLIGYQVSNSITVKKREIASAGKLLQAAISAGVNQSSGLSFSAEDSFRTREVGLREAFEDARFKAMVLAQAAGRKVGPAMAITEGGASTPQPRPMMGGRVMAAQVVSEVPVETGSEEVAFTVSVVFAMR